MWKVICSGEALLKACTDLIDAVNVKGAGSAGSVSTLTLNAATGGSLMKARVVTCDHVTLVLRNEVLERSKARSQLKSLVNEVKLQAARDGACVAKLSVEYETVDDGGALAPEDTAALVGGYLGMLKTVEAYPVANPAEYA